MASSSVVLSMRGIRKSFGPTHALRGVDLEVMEGEVHALVGENGAGKSTLMKVLSGAVGADSGDIWLGGAPYTPSGPSAARERGVSMIYQELNLAPDLSVEENIFLGMERATCGFVKQRRQRRAAREALDLLGHLDIEPSTIVETLSLANQQIVEIARALVARARLIVLDEPTSSLTLVDTERLFGVIERLSAQGVSFVYISHFLEEVKRVASRFTVLREGETVGSGSVAKTEIDAIISLMIGRPLEQFYPDVPHMPGEPILSVERLVGDREPRGVDFELRRGEILGIAGLVGAGRTETLRAIYGLDPVRSGAVKIASFSSGSARPSVRVRQGVAFVSENRKEEGLAVELSIADNITLSYFEPVSMCGWIPPARQRDAAQRCIKTLGVKCESPLSPVSSLSGGNQQKVALARVLHQEAEIILLDEPTRGIDVGSKIEVYRLMGELAASDKAVLFVSSYFPELLGVADRVAVMHRGRLSPIRAAGEWSEQSMMAYATKGSLS